ncbi:hypothetical protein WKU96_23935, partial [Salmonella enterica]
MYRPRPESILYLLPPVQYRYIQLCFLIMPICRTTCRALPFSITNSSCAAVLYMKHPPGNNSDEIGYVVT